MTKLLQHAILCDGVIYKSSHRYDFVWIDEAKGHFIDGGLKYIRGSWPPKHDPLLITTDHSMAERVRMAVWGKLINEKRVWVFLKDCSSDHLQNILPLLPDDDWKRGVIQHILASRPKKRVFDQIRNRLLMNVCADLS